MELDLEKLLESDKGEGYMINKMLDKIRVSKFANRVLSLLGCIGLDKVFILILYRYYEKHPTETMHKSVQYFDLHRPDIRMVRNLFADEKSKQVWLQMIKFRKTMNYKVHPGCEMPSYFVKGIIKFDRQEVFVGCGSFDGRTSFDFIQGAKSSGGGYRLIVVFEPDALNFKQIEKNMKNISNVCLFPKGLWNRKTSLRFCADGTAASKVLELGEEYKNTRNESIIQVTAMDDVPECQDATFIKMDLEGSEMMALKGAETIIKRNKPKLAICIYHSDQDMLEIIKYIHQLVPEYRLYIRHHSTSYIDTVLYAVC